MGLLKKAENQTVYLKAGLYGFPGSGKTFTAAELAIGISRDIGDNKPVAFLDTETGSDFLIQRFEEEGIELLVLKSRAFKDLIEVIKESEQSCSVLIVDSVTHIWTDLMRSFEKVKKRRNGLLFQDWSAVKQEWARFTTLYLNSKVHIIMCGRAGFEYDMYEDEAGKKELNKTGVKMKVETDTGYEPSLGVYMERLKKSSVSGNPHEAGIINRAHIEKDRTQRMNGAIIDYPKYKDFEPVISFLNLGGNHVGVEDDRNSEDIFDSDELSGANYRRKLEIALDEIKEEFVLHDMSGTSQDTKKKRSELLIYIFGTPSWKAIEEKNLKEVQGGLERLRKYFDNPEEVDIKESDEEVPF